MKIKLFTGQCTGRNSLDLVAHQSQVIEFRCGVEGAARQLSDLIVIGKQAAESRKESHLTRQSGQLVVVQIQFRQVGTESHRGGVVPQNGADGRIGQVFVVAVERDNVADGTAVARLDNARSGASGCSKCQK